VIDGLDLGGDKMEKLGFKDAMSLVPTSVSVLRVTSSIANPQVVAATISSLISLSVVDGEEEIMFALKNNSYFGQRLLEEKVFSISVLNSGQDYLARKYGSSANQLPDLTLNEEESWVAVGNSFYLRNSLFVLFCELTDHDVRKHSTLYFGKIFSINGSLASTPLVYQNRKFKSVIST
jgi:hypothetical protein